MEPRIVIIVEGGLVQSVLSDTKEVCVDVIDLDTDDEEEAESAEAAYNEARADLASGSLCIVY